MARDEEGRSVDQGKGETRSASKNVEEGPAAAEQPKSEERASRFDNAKAFFRALNAGADVAADDFGINLAPGSGGSERSGPCMSCKSLQESLTQAEAKASEAENLYKRMAADFENYRKRIDREREEFVALGIQRGVESILPAMDDLDRAQSSFTEASDSKSLLDSLKLIYGRFTKCFEQLGVKPLEVIAEPFDPRLHEPVQQVQTNDVPEGHIAHELRRGYLYKDKVVRPALVNVAVPKEEAEPNGEKDEVAKGEAEKSEAVVLETTTPATQEAAASKDVAGSARDAKAIEAEGASSALSDSEAPAGHIDDASSAKKSIQIDIIDPTTMTADLPVVRGEDLTGEDKEAEPSQTYDLSEVQEDDESAPSELAKTRSRRKQKTDE